MPITPTYPGVYIEEIPSGVRTIVPVKTAITAFVGRASRGPTNKPTTVQSFGQFQRLFGGLAIDSAMSYAVAHYFQNGGGEALIVRVAAGDAVKAGFDIGGLKLAASGDGKWGNQLRAHINHQTRDADSTNPPPDEKLFNLFVYDADSGTLEEFRNVSVDKDAKRFVKDILEDESALVTALEVPDSRPPANALPDAKEWFDDDNTHTKANGAGLDGGPINDAAILGEENQKSGIFALEKAELFNILCLPPAVRGGDVEADTYSKALEYCRKRRAMLFVDPPSGWKSVASAAGGVTSFRGGFGGETLMRNAAIFFPRIKMADQLKEGRVAEFVPCGAVAGICARTDVQRGVWKSPAGIEAGLSGVREFAVGMTDEENGLLNPLGVNCLREFTAHGRVVWGSRTMAGDDRLASEWKYLAVRRFTLFLEESLYRGTQWIVFEPNDEPLWAQIRLNIGTFMQDLFRQGAFQGTTPSEAYEVKCDSDTTQQSDIDRGIVNIEVRFAPLKPAEFVIIKIQQKTRRDN